MKKPVNMTAGLLEGDALSEGEAVTSDLLLLMLDAVEVCDSCRFELVDFARSSASTFISRFRLLTEVEDALDPSCLIFVDADTFVRTGDKFSTCWSGGWFSPILGLALLHPLFLEADLEVAGVSSTSSSIG